MRRGVCFSSKRYAKANNLYIKSYSSKKPHNFIISYNYWRSIDANNLYGFAMNSYLPVDG